MAAVRSMLASAESQADLLARHGLVDAFLGDFKRAVTKLEAVDEAARAGRLAHVGAGADLEAVSGELVQLVAMLDGINRYRFRTDGALHAAWKSARNVFGPARAKVAAPPAEAGAPLSTP